MKFKKITDVEVTVNVSLNPEDIKQLPQAMQDCYNGLCKYAKPDSFEEIAVLWGYVGEKMKEYFSLFLACIDWDNNCFSVSFDDNEDYILTEQERITLRNMFVELMVDNRNKEGVTKCV